MTLSAYAIIAANLLPLCMAAGGGWGIREILPLYWFESGIIGFFNILKILFAQGPITSTRQGAAAMEKLRAGPLANLPPSALSKAASAGKILLAAFFTFHFGMFMFGHGIFLFGLILGGFRSGSGELNWLAPLLNVKWAVLALFSGHAVSFVLNFVLGGEYKQVNAMECMSQPYSRIFVMHLTILLGAFVSALFTNLAPVMVVFVALKIFTDVKAHLKERTRAAAGGAAQVPATAI